MGQDGMSGAHEDPEDIAADVSDFVADFLADEDRGELRPLWEYLSRYRRSEAGVALEYLRLSGLLGSGSGPRGAGSGGSATSPGSGEAPEGPADGATRIGRYRLQRLLGKGGQGEVWLAEDEGLQRPVALKLLGGQFVSEDRRLRFRREAESIARLEHPGLAQVHDAVVEGDTPYIAMRFVEGVDLATSFRRRAEESRRQSGESEAPKPAGSKGLPPPLPWVPESRHGLTEVLRFFERTARALHAAHEAGVLHRDVKPGNIMVTPERRPVLLDFGLATGASQNEAHPTSGETSALTRQGDVFGTLSYMSPEQLRGETANVDERSDVWSLGVTLFEALTGTRPFQEKTPGLLAAAVEEGRVPDVRSRNDALGKDVSVVLATALEPDRNRRYKSALEFAEDLRRIVEYEPVRARPAGPWLRMRRWARREPAWAATLVGTLIALVGALVASQRALAVKQGLLDSVQAREFSFAVPELNRRAPAGALALGLKAVDLDDTWSIRSTLYGPLLSTTLASQCTLPRPRVWDVEYVDSKTLLAGANGGTAGLFDVSTGALLASVDAGQDVLSLAIQPARVGPGRVAVIGLRSGELLGLDVPAEAELDGVRTGAPPMELLPRWRIRGLGGPVRTLKAAADGGFCGVLAPATVVRIEAATGKTLARFEDPGGRVGAMELLSDPSRVLVGDVIGRRGRDRSKEVTLLDGQSLGVVRKVAAPGEVMGFSVAEEAGIFGTLDGDGRVRLYSGRTGELLLNDVPGAAGLGGQGADFGELGGAALALSADGSLLAVGLGSRLKRPGMESLFDPEKEGGTEAPSTLRMFRIHRPLEGGGSTGGWWLAPLWSARAVRSQVLDLAFSHTDQAGAATAGESQGPLVAVADFSNRVTVLDGATGADEGIHVERKRTTNLLFAPDGSTLAAIGVSRSVNVWRMGRSAGAFRLDPVVRGERRPVVFGGLGGGGRAAVLLEEGGRAGVFSLGETQEPGTLIARVDGLGAGAFARHAEIALDRHRGVALWVAPSAGLMRAFSIGSGGSLEPGAVLGETLIQGLAPGPLRALDVVVQGPGEGGAGPVRTTGLLIDGGGDAWLWDGLNPPERIGGPWFHGRLVQGAGSGYEFVGAPAPSGAPVVVKGSLGAGGAQERGEPLPCSDPLTVSVVAVSPNGGRLAAATDLNRPLVWSLGERLQESPRGVVSKVTSIAWLDDERILTAALGPGSLKVVGAGEPVFPTALHAGPITAIGAAREADVVLTGSLDRTVLAWDASSGEPLARLRIHGGEVRSVAGVGGRSTLRILSCGDDGAFVVPLDVVGAARGLASRPLSRADMADFEAIRGTR